MEVEHRRTGEPQISRMGQASVLVSVLETLEGMRQKSEISCGIQWGVFQQNFIFKHS